jgi:hypothetical protein
MGSFFKVVFALAAVVVIIGAACGLAASIYAGRLPIALLFCGIGLLTLILFIIAIYIGLDAHRNSAANADRLVPLAGWPVPQSYLPLSILMPDMHQSTTRQIGPYRGNWPVMPESAETSPTAPEPLNAMMIMAKYSWLDNQLHVEQIKLAIAERDAVRMRQEIFAQCLTARLSGSGVQYPTCVSDPLAMDIQVEFAKRVRPYQPATSAVRDSTFASSAARLLVNISKACDQEISWQETLTAIFSYLTRDELIVRFFIERDIDVRDISALLRLDIKHVQHIVNELDDLFTKISWHAWSHQKKRKASQMAKQMDARLSGALLEWILGRKTA